MRHRNERPARRAMRAVAALTAAAMLATAVGSCDDSPTEPRDRELLLGGLFSLTGNWSTLGRTGRAAMELAVEDVNQYLAGHAAGFHLAAAVEDTRLDPAVALEKAQALRARGVQVLIGPQSSAEVMVLKPFVDASGMILVSPSSTAGSLAVAGDNVFRFTPADVLEGVAVSALMWDDGIRVVVPVWRDDPGNAGLVTAVRARITALGGTVLEGIVYGATATDFGTTVAALSAQLQPAIEQYGAGSVAVYLAGFDEVAQLFESASTRPELASVRWYGSDGVARSEPFLANPQAVEFAARVGYPNPLPGVEEGTRDHWASVIQRIQARANLEPDAFALAVYDAVWVVGMSHLSSGATLGTEELKAAFVAVAATHFGVSGWTALDAAGDRRHGNFDFWAVQRVGDVPRWVRVAYYETRTGLLRRP